jgi:uncharacterized protein (DUF362 family)
VAVYLARQPRYDVTEIRQHLEDALAAIGAKPAGRTAVIKPNLVNQFGDSSGTTTSPAIVEAVYGALRDRGFDRITIADGPSVNRPVDLVFKNSGMAALAERLGCDLVDLNQAERRPVPWPYGELPLPTLILDADYYVNVPKMKTHVRCGVTLGLKNQQGICDYDEKKNNHKRGVDEPLGTLGKVLKPHLLVLDGVEGMEGNGPTHGTRNKPQVFAAGTNLVEFDSVLAQVMGFSVDEVPMIAYATEAPCEQEVVGMSIEEARTPFVRPNQGEFQRMMGLRIWSNIRSCNGCDLHVTIAKESLRSNPRKFLKYGPGIVRQAIFGRTDVLKGEQSLVPEQHGRLVFIGDCTADLADGYDGTFVPGCPPDPDEILNALASAGALE